MCLIVARKIPPKSWDGYVYKCFMIYGGYSLISPYRQYFYSPDQCVSVKHPKHVIKGSTISDGIHAFYNKKDAKNYLKYNTGEVCVKIKVKRSDVIAWGQHGDIVLSKFTVPAKLYNKALRWTKQSKKSRIIGDL